jgi:hypothetical protein
VGCFRRHWRTIGGNPVYIEANCTPAVLNHAPASPTSLRTSFVRLSAWNAWGDIALRLIPRSMTVSAPPTPKVKSNGSSPIAGAALSRGLVEIRDKNYVILISIATVDMRDYVTTTELHGLLSDPGDGGITQLSRERGRYRHVAFTNAPTWWSRRETTLCKRGHRRLALEINR